MLRLNLSLKEQYEQLEPSDLEEQRDREFLNRAIYHKILNEIAILKGIAQRLVRSTESAELRRIIGGIEFINQEIGKRRDAATMQLEEVPAAEYDRVLQTVSDTAHDIADFANNEIAVLERRVRRLLKASENTTSIHKLRRLLEQIEFTQSGLNDLKTANESILLNIAAFPARHLFANWEQNPKINNASITVEMDNPDALFHGDEQKLKAIFKELVDNATKHNPDKAVLQIRLRSRDLDALPGYVLPGKKITGKRKYLNIIYTDDGEGIPEDRKEWIFQPLKTTSKEGSGLGLFIISKTVRAMGGYILERGVYGTTEGARFEIYLPYGVEK